MSPKYDCHCIKIGAEELGFPIMRRRTYGVGINQETLIWVGPRNPEDVAADVYRLFGRTVILDADMYCGLASDTSADEYLKHLAQLRGVLPRP